MNKEQQRIAIAEACGWRLYGSKRLGVTAAFPSGPPQEIPDYLNGLNAMHEAEKACILETFEKSLLFRNALHKICCDGHNYKIEASLIWHATADQRAEAFLRALNLWKE